MDYKLRHLSYISSKTLFLFQPRGCRPSWWRTRGTWGQTWGRDTHRPTWCRAPTWGSTTRTSRTSPPCWPPGTPTDSTCSPCRCPTRWVTMIISENQWNESSTARTDRNQIFCLIWSSKSNFFSRVFHFLWRLQAERDMSLCYPLRCDGPWTAWTTKLITISIWQGFFCKTWFGVLWMVIGNV